MRINVGQGAVGQQLVQHFVDRFDHGGVGVADVDRHVLGQAAFVIEHIDHLNAGLRVLHHKVTE